MKDEAKSVRFNPPEAVKAIDKNVVVLVITGYGTIDTAVSAIKAGAYDFISKPFDFKALEVVINRFPFHLFFDLNSFLCHFGRRKRMIALPTKSLSVIVWS